METQNEYYYITVNFSKMLKNNKIRGKYLRDHTV